MLSIQSSERTKGKCMPNVLPCGIKHDGSVNSSTRYWAPVKGDGGMHTAYFRGRKLQGRELKLPEDYEGVILASKAASDGQKTYDEDEEDRIVERISEEVATFDRVMVWDHGVIPDETSGRYLRGIEEWISFAQTIHEVPEKSQKKL